MAGIIGAVGFSVMTIRPADSAVAMGLGDLPIAAPAHFVTLLESAALAALADHLQPGETTRMLSIELHCLDAVGIGCQLRATATCTEIVGRDLHFVCDIYEGNRHIAQAQMTRATVERVSFLARTAAQSLNSQIFPQ
ncbi:MAG: hypothetical protein NT152_02145 [Actinobacteria bacterium]|nr:hypothetical protein [Actinomycetota bacterium]